MAKSAVSLRVFGDDLEPDEITTVLGSSPSTSYRKGDLISPGRSDAIRKYGMWILKAPDSEPDDFKTQVDQLLSTVTQDFAVWRSLGQRYQVDLFCGFFMDTRNQGFTLAVQTMRALLERGVEPGFDVYAPTPEEEAEYWKKQEGTTGEEPV
jgi:ribosomal protein L19